MYNPTHTQAYAENYLRSRLFYEDSPTYAESVTHLLDELTLNSERLNPSWQELKYEQIRELIILLAFNGYEEYASRGIEWLLKIPQPPMHRLDSHLLSTYVRAFLARISLSEVLSTIELMRQIDTNEVVLNSQGHQLSDLPYTMQGMTKDDLIARCRHLQYVMTESNREDYSCFEVFNNDSANHSHGHQLGSNEVSGVSLALLETFYLSLVTFVRCREWVLGNTTDAFEPYEFDCKMFGSPTHELGSLGQRFNDGCYTGLSAGSVCSVRINRLDKEAFKQITLAFAASGQPHSSPKP